MIKGADMMKLTDFNIAAFNSSAEEATAGQKLNFCRAVSMSYDYNMSVTARYIPTVSGDSFTVLDSSLRAVTSNDFDKFYYGVSPKFDSDLVISAISEGCFTTAEGLDSFISSHCDYFMLHSGMERYLPDFARHAVLTVAGKYGVRFSLPEDIVNKLREADIHGEIVAVEKNAVCIRGCPLKEMADILSQYRYIKREKLWHIASDGIAFSDIYKNKKNVELLQGRVFYSGVLIKAMNIGVPEERFENFNMKNISIGFERSTFAAVCAFDEVHVAHPLISSDSRERLIEMLAFDDGCKKELSEQLKGQNMYNEETVLSFVNQYLLNSYNVNQIGVTANLISRGDVLLLGMRDSKNIDEGILYPGINGNAEIKDDDVAFYAYSVYEDEPTILLDSKRIDFVGEISREAYGEIRIDYTKMGWLCYGIAMSGQIPEKSISAENYLGIKRRMHMNIIFEQKSDMTHAEIQENKNKAAEAYETVFFKGIRVRCYKNIRDRLFQWVSDVLRGIVENKDIIESVSLISVILLSVFSDGGSFEFSWESVLSLIFAALIILVSILKAIRYFSSVFVIRNKRIRKRYAQKILHLYCKDSYQKMTEKMNKAMGKAYHPATYSATKLYVENRLYDKLKKEEEKKNKKK